VSARSSILLDLFAFFLSIATSNSFSVLYFSRAEMGEMRVPVEYGGELTEHRILGRGENRSRALTRQARVSEPPDIEE